MFNSIIDSIIQCISASTNWFYQIFDAIPNALTFVFGMFVVYLSYRFLVRPLVHGGFKNVGSDRSKKSNNQEE